ncbi:DUF6265 family protein [Longimicrobium sp.]|uniref:DUF6265 family protein n=1 Tax=Longimicrobium sp. TaxID=2029185 RepID=UPI002E318D25|nr:DUF6265 family protein [Longimicrobium sp.]HEX6037285.1 DUF6265 family protein [Longimicrobium sp.]
MRMRWMTAVLAPALLGAAPMQRDAQGPLSALAFMSGCWRGTGADSTTIEETWTAADADAMLATTRYLRDGRVRGWEFSRIHADSAGQIVLTPYPDGAPAAPFRLEMTTEGTAVFSNPENDFPQNIIYRGDGETILAVRLDGGGPPVEWRMLPGACGT